ncbi:hypothetical protein JY651_48565 [Pyxidicoccus parkwayensis]|uniref:Uncharacterized protein n=1 Tax=Pyxidicoccus parkwayensis TaxID=2813578 RepID=A0ABX7NWW9_9BACT|nr:hypothetical protein [Pyxidicoccus parkwaysis]QSQ22869.1 hypothetical protein JY651_48565 [Pyxidicoccus parkwaysis]
MHAARFVLPALLSALLIPSLGGTGASAPLAESCYDECNAANSSCPAMCGATPAQCSQAYDVCIDSCNRGVGPWLPC